MKREQYLSVALGVFAATLVVAVATKGSGVVADDPSRNIVVPDQLFMPMQLKAAYNDEQMFIRYRFPADRPHFYHDAYRYTNGEWQPEGRSVPGPQPQGIYEDRVTMLIDDGGVPEFARYGGYITVGDGMRYFTNAATRDEVVAHPYLGQEKRQTDVRKYLPATRSVQNDWRTVVDPDTIAAQRQAGYFLDMWQWRSHRGNPVGYVDDGGVHEIRLSDSGGGAFFTNWDGDARRPQLMFDVEQTGIHALRWDDLVNHRLGQDDLYYLHQDMAVPFDPDHAWQEGDVIPRRVLRNPGGSRADIKVHGEGRWRDGHWEVTMVRALDTGHPLEDKILHDQGRYDVAFAVHRDATGSRWHYVSMPFTLGLGREAEIEAVKFNGAEPNWSQPWTEMTLFYPGQVSWPMLKSKYHAGADAIRAGVPVKVRHNEYQLAHYGLETEFREEIVSQWRLSIFAGLALVIGLGSALISIARKESAQ